jgi:hypothetical protein
MTFAIEDRQQILDLYGEYAHAIDSGDADACAACFASNGVLRVGDREGQLGRNEIADFARNWRASLDTVPRHISWHVLLNLDAGSVRGIASAALLTTDADGRVRIAFTCTYHDRFVRESDRWVIGERFVVIDRVTSG